MTDRAEAVRTAGDRLEAIERWSRLSAEATVVGVAILAALACGFAYVGLDYLRFKSAAAEAARQFAERRTAAVPSGGPVAPQRAPARPGR